MVDLSKYIVAANVGYSSSLEDRASLVSQKTYCPSSADRAASVNGFCPCLPMMSLKKREDPVLYK
jgi:hypothetical protein